MKKFLGILFLSCLLTACSKDSLSERDVKKSQLTSAAEIKRKELMQVAGEYQGNLFTNNGETQFAYLTLEIKDIPTLIENQVDPVLMPTLTGYMKMFYGEAPHPVEFVAFTIQKADFDPNRKKLDLTLNEVSYKDVLFSLKKSGSGLEGEWTAPALAISGTSKFVAREVSNSISKRGSSPW